MINYEDLIDSLSEPARRLGRHIVHISERGLMDPIQWTEITTLFPEEDRPRMAEAAYELEQLDLLLISKGLTPDGIVKIRPEYALYWAFDKVAFNQDTEADILTLVKKVLSVDSFCKASVLLDELDWPLRRFNPPFARVAQEFPDGRLSTAQSNEPYPHAGLMVTAEDRMNLRRLLKELEGRQSSAEAHDSVTSHDAEEQLPVVLKINNSDESEPPSSSSTIEPTTSSVSTPDQKTGGWFHYVITHPVLAGLASLATLISIVFYALAPLTSREDDDQELPRVIKPVEETVSGSSDEAGETATPDTPPSHPSYDPYFLGNVHVPLPNITDSRVAGDLLNGAPISFPHFSIAIDERRGMALYSAVNVDRDQLVDIPRRERGPWTLDPRVPRDLQRGQDLYVGNDYDRGHLVRSAEAAWGPSEEALAAAQATQSYVNTVPQHSEFNRGAWLGLELHTFSELEPEARRLTVFSGPIYRNDDYEYRASRIPRSFWKVVAYLDPQDDRNLKVHGFIADQYRLVDGQSIPTNTSRSSPEAHSASIRDIEKLTTLRFGVLKDFDAFGNQ